MLSLSEPEADQNRVAAILAETEHPCDSCFWCIGSAGAAIFLGIGTLSNFVGLNFRPQLVG